MEATIDNLLTPTLQYIGTVLFVLAVLHTFLVKQFEHWAHKFPPGSMGEVFFHLLGEVEVVFGMWAGVFVLIFAVTEKGALYFLEQQNYTEPAFVFVIMCMAATRPIIRLAQQFVGFLSRLLPLPRQMAFYIAALMGGPLLGSLITEPAAMTVTAMILLDQFFTHSMSKRLQYATLGLLFVNVSIGGTLTNFAAPPVLMVAGKWGWSVMHMLRHFGYKAIIAIVISTLLTAWFFRRELAKMPQPPSSHLQRQRPIPVWVTMFHVLFLVMVVYTSHHMVFFLGLFLFFLGFVSVTRQVQDPLKLRESLLVGFFLGGLVTLGAAQKWWLQPAISSMGEMSLYLGATLLTGITDNAALTYLGSLVENLSESSKYYLVAGSVIGGGLTVIANAPNPAGYGILKKSFGPEGVAPLGLLLAALPPTLIALICFYVLA